VRYHAALLVLADLYRYRLGDGSRARDLERRLAEDAERFGHLRLAAVQWLSVGEIEEQALGDKGAASAAYERVLRLGRQAEGLEIPRPPAFLLDVARQSLDRLHAGEPAHQRALPKLVLPYPGDMFVGANDVSALIIPHLNAYSDGARTIEARRNFAQAHPGSFRAVFAEYTGVLLAFVFPNRVGSPLDVLIEFVDRYPQHVLAFVADGQRLGIFQRMLSTEAYEATLEAAQARAKEAGIELEVTFERKDT
jgi:hypothetical protein